MINHGDRFSYGANEQICRSKIKNEVSEGCAQAFELRRALHDSEAYEDVTRNSDK